MKLGYTVSRPICDDSQYDLLIDVNHKIYKIQCKHPNLVNNSLVLECTTNINTRTRLETYTYDPNNVDLFATYYQDKCYLIPFNEVRKSFTLRLDDTKNGSSFGIHWAEDYEADFIISRLIYPNKKYELPSAHRSHSNIKMKSTHYIWITDGKVNKQFAGSLQEIPEGFQRGRSGRCNQYS